MLENLISFRKQLHQHPELSGDEVETAKNIIHFMRDIQPDEIIENIGGTGVAFVFNGENPGDTVMLRADLDALPICELNSFNHKSRNEGVSHKCGHDGHMTILAGLATLLKYKKIKSGKLVLLFQPSEENGEGASKVIADRLFESIRPDFVFALHNLPGLKTHCIAVRDRHITSASSGMKIQLTGQTAHAMAPEQGNSPIEAVKKIHSKLQTLFNSDRKSENFSLITTVGIQVGSEDYGVAPADGALYLTVRAYKNEVMSELKTSICSLCEAMANTYDLKLSISYKDVFTATVNDGFCTRIVREAAQQNQLLLKEPDQCMGFSEDFGRLIDSARKGGAFFLLGCGETHPGLHTPEYDFNDDIIIDGVNMFYSVIERLLGFNSV